MRRQANEKKPNKLRKENLHEYSLYDCISHHNIYELLLSQSTRRLVRCMAQYGDSNVYDVAP